MLDAAKLDRAKWDIDARFNQRLAALAGRDAFLRSLAEVVPMSGPSVEFDWLGFVGAVKRWSGNRKLDEIRAKNFSFSTAEWEDSLRVKGVDIRDDKLDLYNSRIQSLADAFLDFQERLIVDALLSGFVTTTDFGACYDGTALLNDSHPLDNGATNDNLLTATLDDAGALKDAFKLMRKLKRDDGQPLNLEPTVLLCGPDYEEDARKILLAQFGSAGATNTDYNRMKLHVSPFIASGRSVGNDSGKKTARTVTGTEWFLIDLSKPVKPLFRGVRENIWSDSVGMGSETHFLNRDLLFGAACSENVAPAFYQTVVASSGTA
jgi:phage major head subunit gpT-like protein